MNALQMLKDDHKKVRGLLAELAATTKRASRKRADLLAAIAREIEVHTSIEEEIFYPAFKKAADNAEDQKLFFAALEEHRAATELVLPDLQRTSPESDQFSGRAKVLKELIESHVNEEETQMFARVRQLIPAAELRALGERMAERKLELAEGSKTLRAVKRAGRLVGAIAAAVLPADEVQVPGVARTTAGSRGNGRGRGQSAARNSGSRARH